MNTVTRNTYREANCRNGRNLRNAVSRETRKQTRMSICDSVTVAEIEAAGRGEFKVTENGGGNRLELDCAAKHEPSMSPAEALAK